MSGWRRPWLRSIRARVTAVALVVIGLLMMAGVAGNTVTVYEILQSEGFGRAAHVARMVADDAERGALPAPLPADGPVLLIQVVDASGNVVAASSSASTVPPVSRARPTAGDKRVDVTICNSPVRRGTCLYVVGFEAHSAQHGDVMVYVAVPEPLLLTTNLLPLLLAAAGLAFVVLVGWVLWRAIGRALAPVDQIGAVLGRITSSDLGRRVPVPDTEDEVARLAHTVNATLNRLERSAGQQRQFVSDVSHELRSPITGLRTRLELALSDPGEEDLLATLRAALADTQRLQNVVEELLVLARLDADAEGLERAPVDLAELVTTEVDRRPWRWPITTRLAEGVLVRGDRLELARVLTNLLANAMRHAVGSVEVVVDRDEAQDRALLEVRDDGPGIPPGDRDRVFERFVRLADSRARDAAGSGLGLSIARDIATAHSGTLTVEDSERGARLVLRLPLLSPWRAGTKNVSGGS